MALMLRRLALAGLCAVILGMLPGEVVAQSVLPSAAELGVGDADSDVVFTPVTPCRLIDTRVVGPAFNANETRNYNLIGPSSYASLGGNGAGCDIPATTSPIGNGTIGNTVRALVLSFSAVPVPGESGDGHLRAWPTNASMPQAAVLTFGNAMFALTNGVPVATCSAAVASGEPCPAGDLSIFAGSSKVDIVVDVLGYYAPQRFQLASNRTQYGVYAIDFVATAALDEYTSTAGLTFSPPLSSPPIPEFIARNASPTPRCPGSISDPTASPGALCLYESLSINISSFCITHQLSEWSCQRPPDPWPFSADPMGAAIKVSTTGPGRAVMIGVWAVTAP